MTLRVPICRGTLLAVKRYKEDSAIGGLSAH